jgi:hypothetical protein
MGDTVMEPPETDPPDQDPRSRPAERADDPAEQGAENPQGDRDLPPNVHRERHRGLRMEEGERLREEDERQSER